MQLLVILLSFLSLFVSLFVLEFFLLFMLFGNNMHVYDGSPWKPFYSIDGFTFRDK